MKVLLLKINKIIEEIDFDVVTDDVEWVKNNSIFSKKIYFHQVMTEMKF